MIRVLARRPRWLVDSSSSGIDKIPLLNTYRISRSATQRVEQPRLCWLVSLRR